MVNSLITNSFVWLTYLRLVHVSALLEPSATVGTKEGWHLLGAVKGELVIHLLTVSSVSEDSLFGVLFRDHSLLLWVG